MFLPHLRRVLIPKQKQQRQTINMKTLTGYLTLIAVQLYSQFHTAEQWFNLFCSKS